MLLSKPLLGALFILLTVLSFENAHAAVSCQKVFESPAYSKFDRILLTGSRYYVPLARKDLSYVGHDYKTVYFVDFESLSVVSMDRKEFPKNVMLTRALPTIQKQSGPTCFIYALVHLLRELNLRKPVSVVKTNRLYNDLHPRLTKFIKDLTKEFRQLPNDPDVFTQRLTELLSVNGFESHVSKDPAAIIAEIENGKIALLNYRADGSEKYEPVDIDTIEPGKGNSTMLSPILPALDPHEYDGLHTVAIIGVLKPNDGTPPLVMAIDSAIGKLTVLPWDYYQASVLNAVLVTAPPPNVLLTRPSPKK